MAQRKFSPRMSFAEHALQMRAVYAAAVRSLQNGACVQFEGGWAPPRNPEALCLCDLSLLENPNIQTCPLL